MSEPPMDKSDTWLLLRVYMNGLAHLGSTKKYQMMGDNLLHSLPPDNLRSAPETPLCTLHRVTDSSYTQITNVLHGHLPTVQLCLTILPWLMPWLPHIPAPKTLPLLLGTWVSNHVPSAPSPSHHSGQPAPIDQSHRYGRPQAACREPAGSYDKTTRTAICFEHKTQYLLIRAPYTRIVVFWHISTISPMISQSQISCNTPTVYIAAIFVKYCYTTASWLL